MQTKQEKNIDTRRTNTHP